jgi:hypothetical protein
VRRRLTAAIALGALASLLVLAGCGGDDEETTTGASTTPTETVTETVETETVETVTEPETTPSIPTTPSTTPTSPEDVPGGAGDAEPARTLAQFTGKGGRITPRTIRVPPFIAIRIELRSADGAGYALDFGGGVGVATSPQVASASTQVDGLRANEELVGRPMGGNGNQVRVVASAEPGP